MSGQLIVIWPSSVLFAGVTSPVADTFTVLFLTPQEPEPWRVGVVTCTVRVAPWVRVPNSQSSTWLPTAPVISQGLPAGWLVIAQLRPPSGRLSRSVTLAAGPGPLFVTVIEKTALAPASTEPASGVFTTETSGHWTVIRPESELFVWLMSPGRRRWRCC